jgi:putative nucleotide binding protein
LELLPGIGKKHVFTVLDERQKKPFESFVDIERRVSQIPSVSKAIVKRVLTELEEENEKHLLFCRPPPKEKQFERFSPHSQRY